MANRIAPDALRMTPLDKFILVNADNGATDGVSFTQSDFEFAGIITGFFMIRPQAATWTGSMEIFRLAGGAGNPLSVRLNNPTGSNILSRLSL